MQFCREAMWKKSKHILLLALKIHSLERNCPLCQPATPTPPSFSLQLLAQVKNDLEYVALNYFATYVRSANWNQFIFQPNFSNQGSFQNYFYFKLNFEFPRIWKESEFITTSPLWEVARINSKKKIRMVMTSFKNFLYAVLAIYRQYRQSPTFLPITKILF